MHLRPYQQEAVTFCYERDMSLLLLQMGAGKTVITATAIAELLAEGELRRVLVVAPKRVCQFVWPAEFAGWEHLQQVTRSVAVGTPDQRRRALTGSDAVVFLNFENLAWAVREKLLDDFDGLVIDELSWLKDSSTARFKAIKRVRKRFKWVVGLTGTPTGNSMADLFAEMHVIDGGERLGKTKAAFRQAFMSYDGPNHWNWSMAPGAGDRILDRISDISFQIDDAVYRDQLPDLHTVVHEVELGRAERVTYDAMEREYVADGIAAVTDGVKVNKLAQICQGFLYDEYRGVRELGYSKLAVLQELLEGLGPRIVVYRYEEDLRRVRDLTGGVDVRSQGAIERWNQGQIETLLVQPACLHPDTLVLTEYAGWKRIVEVGCNERVFDGVEFVSHGGCHFSGVKPVIDKFGIRMTADHLILIGDKWVEAGRVPDTEASRKAALFCKWEASETGSGQMPAMRGGGRDAAPAREKSEQGAAETLQEVLRPKNTWHELFEALPNMEGAARTNWQPLRPIVCTLRRAGIDGLRHLERVRVLLARHARRLRGQLDPGTGRQFAGLFEAELSVGFKRGTTGQQAKQPGYQLAWEGTASGGILPTGSRRAGGDSTVFEPAREQWRRSPGSVRSIDLPTQSQEPVYDLINCGPRSRFAVMNRQGEVFIVHNSAAHGINLQHGGCHVVFYGLEWSRERHDQTVARLWRSGQISCVTAHYLVARGTVDQDIMSAIRRKQAIGEAVSRGLRERNSNARPHAVPAE